MGHGWIEIQVPLFSVRERDVDLVSYLSPGGIWSGVHCACSQGGKLQVSPGKGMLEIYKGDAVVTSVPFEWKSGEWTLLRLQIIKSSDAWKVEGKAWTQGATEPDKVMISFDEKTEPSSGRASIWGSPFSTLPIQYDDLLVTSAK